MNKRNEMLGNEKISSLLLKLSLPATVGMIVNALYNIVDGIFIGQFVDKDGLGLGLAGVTVAMPIQLVVMAFSLLIGIGAASAVSRALGEKNADKANHVAGNAILSIIIISACLCLIGFMFTGPLLRIFGATPDNYTYAWDYIRVILIGTTYFPFVMTTNNLIRAEGNAKVSMMIMIIGTGLNLILDPLFIGVFGLGVSGAAIATIISQFASFIYIIVYFLQGKSTLRIKLHHYKPDFHILWEVISVGFSSFARNIAGSIVAIVLNNSLKIYGGDAALTVYGIINRVLMFLFMPLFGVVQGMQPIAGFNYGAKQYKRVKEVLKLSMIITTVLATAGTIIGMLIPELIIKLFKNSETIINDGTMALRIILIAIPIIGIQIVGSTLFQSLGKAVPSLILSLLRQVIILIPLLIILPPLFENKLLAIWIAFPISDTIATIITIFLIKRQLQSLEKEETDHQELQVISQTT